MSRPKIVLHPLSGYSFDQKEHQQEEDPSVSARLTRLMNEYDQYGPRISVGYLNKYNIIIEAGIIDIINLIFVMLVHEHNHPHILMLQIANTFFKLPGDSIKQGESESSGLKSRLSEKISPPNELNEDWDIGELLTCWYRPNFETFMYPYLPAHITKPKEIKKLFLVRLPPKKMLAVPRNMKLLAVPLFELYDNAQRYGPQLSALPHLLSRFDFEYA